MPDASNSRTGDLVTSARLSTVAVAGTWVLALSLLAAAVVATFLERSSGLIAVMFTLGGLLAVVALMRRIPLRLEVAGTRVDATYARSDEAFDAGRDSALALAAESLAESLSALSESNDQAMPRGVQRHIMADWAGRARQGSALPESSDGPDAHPLISATSGGPNARGNNDDSLFLESGESELDPAGYRGYVACKVASLTYRQLDYWAQTGLVEPSVRRGDGPPLYSSNDIALIAITKKLLDTGVSLQQIRTLVAALREMGDDAFTTRAVAYSDGSTVRWATSPEELWSATSSTTGFFVDSSNTYRDVRRRLNNLRPGANGER